jgi:hypothetical protein
MPKCRQKVVLSDSDSESGSEFISKRYLTDQSRIFKTDISVSTPLRHGNRKSNSSKKDLMQIDDTSVEISQNNEYDFAPELSSGEILSGTIERIDDSSDTNENNKSEESVFIE